MNKEKNFDFGHFLHLAYSDYCKYVKTGLKTYDRFAKDFLNGNKHPVIGENVNQHSLIMGSLTELFIKRQVLVEYFFCKDNVDDSVLEELLTAHNTTNISEHIIEITAKGRMKLAVNTGKSDFCKDENIKTIKKVKPITITMNDSQLDAVAELITGKEEGFDCLVDDDFQGADLFAVLQGRKQIDIRKRNNYKLFMILDAMAYARLITHNWRPFFEHKESLISEDNNLPIKATQMHNSLSNGKKKHLAEYERYMGLLRKIAGKK